MSVFMFSAASLKQAMLAEKNEKGDSNHKKNAPISQTCKQVIVNYEVLKIENLLLSMIIIP